MEKWYSTVYCDGAGIFQQIMRAEDVYKPRAVPADGSMSMR